MTDEQTKEFLRELVDKINLTKLVTSQTKSFTPELKVERAVEELYFINQALKTKETLN